MILLDNGKIVSEIAKNLDIGCNIRTNTRYFSDAKNCDWHFHETSTIDLITQGGAKEVRKSGANIYSPGDIFFYPAGKLHKTVSENEISKSIIVEFGNSFYDKLEFSESHIDKAVNDNVNTKLLMIKIQKELFFNDSESLLSIETLLLELLTNSKNHCGGKLPKWIYRLAEILNDRWNEQFTLYELSKEVGVHPITISKHFRRYFSCTLGEYLRKLKINKSINLLRNSNHSLTDIATSCGFSDHSHFTRTFKQMMGLLPKDFRKM